MSAHSCVGARVSSTPAKRLVPAKALKISVVVPVFNEEANLKLLHTRLSEVLETLDVPYEVIYVDDGSLDRSLTVLHAIALEDAAVRILEFTRNFGQTAALSAGFDHAKGEIVVSLDADLQNDPRDIPRLLEKMAQGYDVVSCWRKDRKDPWLTRVLPSVLANRLISWISGVYLHDYGCTLKAYRKDILSQIRLYGQMHRFIPIFANWAGARIAEIPTRHHPRLNGQSKYGLMRIFRVLLDLTTIKILEASRKPHYVVRTLVSQGSTADRSSSNPRTRTSGEIL